MRSRLQRIQQKRKNKQIVVFMFAIIAITLIFQAIGNKPQTIKAEKPISKIETIEVIKVEEKKSVEIIPVVKAVELIDEDDFKKTDTFVGDAVDEFFTNPSQRSEVRMIMHCLLNRESKHNVSKGKGDGGLAEGPLQYHEGTWIGYRKIMIKRDLATEIGSQFDLKESIRTTVWAISDGRATAWGPILRYQNKQYAESTCPTPSFY